MIYLLKLKHIKKMKIDIGESIVGSWLKHICGCQIIEHNWKPSKKWGNVISPKKVEEIFKAVKKEYKKDLDVEFVSKDVKKLSGFILQGEIDLLGLSFMLDEKGMLNIEKFFAVDVAFHENGLNYSGENKQRILKKYIRTALTLYQYFGVNSGEIIFVTPYIARYSEELKGLSEDLKRIFSEHNINFEFKLYCNEDFYEKVYFELYKMKDEISNSSELFMRSLKLIELTTKKYENSISENKQIIIKQERSSELKIGATVIRDFDILSKENRLSKEEIDKLSDSEYSKDKFGIPFPVLIKDNGKEDCGYIKEIRRYYVKKYRFNKQDYFLCNHWIEDYRGKYNKWVSVFYSKA